jgi:hypothetical protein
VSLQHCHAIRFDLVLEESGRLRGPRGYVGVINLEARPGEPPSGGLVPCHSEPESFPKSGEKGDLHGRLVRKLCTETPGLDRDPAVHWRKGIVLAVTARTEILPAWTATAAALHDSFCGLPLRNAEREPGG